MTKRQAQCLLLPVIFFGLILDAIVSGQKTGTRPQAASSKDAAPGFGTKRPPEILNLITVVQAAPPEFAADMLITIADSSKVPDTAWKKELLREAFKVAADCQYRIPQRDVGPYRMDTRATFLAEAFGLKLDTLSLRCRAIRSMLQLDKPLARQMFNEIEKFRFPALSCGDGLVYRLSDYYSTAGELIEEAFSPEELKAGEHMRLLESLIENISSPLQIGPAANLIRSLHSLRASRDQRESLVAALASKLSKVSGDDRSFSQSISNSMSSVGYEVWRLLDSCRQYRISTTELIKELRSFYVRHFSASRCSDTFRNDDDTGPLPREVAEFNSRLRALGEKEISEIEGDEVRPSKVEGKVDAQVIAESDESRRLGKEFNRLRYGPGTIPLTAAEMENPEWRQSLREFLIRLSDWRGPNGESPEDYYYQKCNLIEGLLITLHVGGLERDEVIRQFVILLSGFDAKNLSRIEWFCYVKELLFPQSFSESGGESGEKVRALLESSNNTVLSAYAQLWKTLSSPTLLKVKARRPRDTKP
jgi:hypothetical protein